MKQYLYNVKSVRYEALEWVRVTTDKGKSARVSTIQKYKNEEVQDYIHIDIMTVDQYSNDPSISTNKIQNKPQLTFTQPQLNHSFTKNDSPDWTIIHRRLDHTKDYLIDGMCKEKTMEGLPERYSSKFQRHKSNCNICS